jgi:hypothetical protein
MDVILKAYIQRNKRKKGNNLKAKRERERKVLCAFNAEIQHFLLNLVH